MLTTPSFLLHFFELNYRYFPRILISNKTIYPKGERHEKNQRTHHGFNFQHCFFSPVGVVGIVLCCGQQVICQVRNNEKLNNCRSHAKKEARKSFEGESEQIFCCSRQDQQLTCTVLLCLQTNDRMREEGGWETG